MYNPDVVINILIKALAALPFPDFNLCISLLDERPASTNPDEPDPLPALLPILSSLHNLLQSCRFPAFWALYRSEKAESLRDNYTVECVGFEDAVRDVVIHAVKAAFQRIGSDRLGSYLNLSGMYHLPSSTKDSFLCEGDDLKAYVAKLGWSIDASTGVVTAPPNPDNQIASTVVQENITLPRESVSYSPSYRLSYFLRIRIGQGHYSHTSCMSLVLCKVDLCRHTLYFVRP